MGVVVVVVGNLKHSKFLEKSFLLMVRRHSRAFCMPKEH